MNTHTATRPLASFCMITYNQREFIRDALLSAFAQTYSPLEIIISDDCSTDGTADIIRDEVEKYEALGGPHRIIYFQNKTNLGISGNFNKAITASTGEMVICAAGDDLSDSKRVEVIMGAWITKNKEPLAIYSNAWKIDLSGNVIEEYHIKSDANLGAVAAYSRKLLESFGPIEVASAAEDEVYANRALMIGTRINIPEPLVYYRVNSGVSAGFNNYRARRIKVLRNYELSAYRQLQKDLDFISEKLPVEKRSNIQKKINYRIALANNMLMLLDGKTFSNRLSGFIRLKGFVLHPRIFLLLLLLLPKSIGDTIISYIKRN